MKQSDFRSKICAVCLYMALVFPLASCTAVMASKLLQEDERRADWTDLRRANHAAADSLFQKAGSYINTTQSVYLIRLNNLGLPPENMLDPPIAWIIPQQVGNRMANLGMNVIQPQTAPSPLARLARPEGAEGLPLQITNTGAVQTSQKRQAGRLYLEGDYIYMDRDLLVALRLIDGRNDRILSTIEYEMMVGPDVYTLINPPSEENRLFDDGWMQLW